MAIMELTDKILKKIMPLAFCLLIALNLFSSFANAETKTLMVGVMNQPPFSMITDNNASGIAVDTWKAIMSKQHTPYQFVVANNDFGHALAELQQGKIDVLIGPIVITSQLLQKAYFSLPYYTTKFSILTKKQPASLLDTLKKTVQKTAKFALFGYLILFFIYINLFWFFEKDSLTDNISTSYPRGLITIAWTIILNKKTIPYFPNQPVTRVLSLAWMLISITFFTSVTATVTTIFVSHNLTVNKIKQISDLGNEPVGIIKGTFNPHQAHHLRLNLVEADSFDELLDWLEQDRVKAVIAGQTVLQYLVKTKQLKNLEFIPGTTAVRGYSFAFHQNTPLITHVNISLLQLQESGEIRNICENNTKPSLNTANIDDCLN